MLSSPDPKSNDPNLESATPLSVLLIEDDRADYLIFAAVVSDIEGWKFRLDWIDNYEAALEQMVANEHDLYLIDHQLGKHNGLNLLAEARAQGCCGAMIMLTGVDDRSLDLAAMEAGASDYLTKRNLQPALLERSIRYAVDRNRHEQLLLQQENTLRKTIQMQENTRKIFSYDLHDGLTQQIISCQMQVETCLQALPPGNPALQQKMSAVTDLLRDSVAEARRLITGLRPPIIDESGIVTALTYLVSEVYEDGELNVQFEHDVSFDRLSPPLEINIYRIVQEALSNARRHSQSDSARVHLRQQEDWLHLEIQDHGTGFDPSKVEAGHYGLESVRERARLLDGMAEIQSVPGEGTTIQVRLPVVLA